MFLQRDTYRVDLIMVVAS